jgi:ABC-2 type transport system permease protein/lipopolysaccharide transport system permease protein
MDVAGGVRFWRKWFTFGRGDILQRHCRSVLGPLWITASTAVMVVLYAELFRTNPRDFIPPRWHLVVWGLIASIGNEAGRLFTSYEPFVKQIKLPHTVYVWRIVWAKSLMFAHNLLNQ